MYYTSGIPFRISIEATWYDFTVLLYALMNYGTACSWRALRSAASLIIVKKCRSNTMCQEFTRIHTFSEKVWILVSSWPIPYGQGIYKDSHLFKWIKIWKSVNPCMFPQSKAFGWNLQGFTPFQISSEKELPDKVWILVSSLPIRYGPEIYKDSHLFRW